MINYSFTKHADRQLRKLPIAIQRQIIKKSNFTLLQETRYILQIQFLTP